MWRRVACRPPLSAEPSFLRPTSRSLTDGEFTVSVRVRNTGEAEGAETVQLYAVDPVAKSHGPYGPCLASPNSRATAMSFEEPR